ERVDLLRYATDTSIGVDSILDTMRNVEGVAASSLKCSSLCLPMTTYREPHFARPDRISRKAICLARQFVVSPRFIAAWCDRESLGEFEACTTEVSPVRAKAV